MNAVLNWDWKAPTKAIVSSPDPYEAHIISRAQSILTKGGVVGPVLPYEEALEVVKQSQLHLVVS